MTHDHTTTQGQNAQETVYSGARLVSDGTETPDGWLLVGGGKILDRGTGQSWRQRVGARDVRRVDLDGAWLAPGFVDIHCHGGGGHAFDDGPDAARAALAVHRAHGTTASVLSFVTDTVDAMAERLAWAGRLTREDPTVLGSHAEGPFLDPGHRGAHDPALLVAPEPAAVARLLEAADGTLRQLTLAPELPHGAAAVASLRAAGVRVAVGHTDADYADAAAAFAAGASILTHAFNAMRPIHHREPGPVTAALARPDVVLEVIADAVHVHPRVVNLLFTAAPGRAVLITDAMSAACMGDGAYTLGSLPVTVTDGIARLTHGNSIAGSTLTMDRAVRVAVTEAGVSVPEAVLAATRTPLEALGLPLDRGTLRPGTRADLVVVDDALRVQRVVIGGATQSHAG